MVNEDVAAQLVAACCCCLFSSVCASSVVVSSSSLCVCPNSMCISGFASLELTHLQRPASIHLQNLWTDYGQTACIGNHISTVTSEVLISVQTPEGLPSLDWVEVNLIECKDLEIYR